MTANDDKSSAREPARRGGGLMILAPLLLAGGLGFLLFGQSFFGGVAGGEDAKRGANPALDAQAAQAGFSASQKQAVQDIVKDYLLSNPEILMEVQTALETKLQREQDEKAKVAIAENAKEIYRHPNAAIAGNPDGDITVVEFFDYNCGYCKRGFGDIAKLVENDKNVRVVFAEFPILREESEQAAHIALAARMQGKYWEVHRKLISSKGLVNEASALKAAEEAGLDMTKLKADMNSAEVKGEIERVKTLAKKMGINGTPHFLVGDRTVGGAPENLYELLSKHVAELRKSGCSYC